MTWKGAYQAGKVTMYVEFPGILPPMAKYHRHIPLKGASQRLKVISGWSVTSILIPGIIPLWVNYHKHMPRKLLDIQDYQWVVSKCWISRNYTYLHRVDSTDTYRRQLFHTMNVQYTYTYLHGVTTRDSWDGSLMSFPALVYTVWTLLC